jgi:hypothetical protein
MSDELKTIGLCHERQEHRLDIGGASVPDKLPGDYEHGTGKESSDRSAREILSITPYILSTHVLRDPELIAEAQKGE